VTGIESGHSADLLQFLAGELEVSSGEVQCYMDGAGSGPIKLGRNFRLYLIASRGPIHTGKPATSSRAVMSDAADTFLAFREHYLPACAMRNVVIVQFCGGPRVSTRRVRLHVDDGDVGPKPGVPVVPGVPVEGEAHRHMYRLRAERIGLLGVERQAGLRDRLASLSAHVAWAPCLAEHPKVKRVFAALKEVADTTQAVATTEAELLTYLLRLREPCQSGFGLIYRIFGSDQLVIDVLKAFRTTLAGAHLKVKGALLYEAKLLRMRRSVQTLVEGFLASVHHVHQALQISRIASAFSDTGLAHAEDVTGTFRQCLKAEKILESLRQCTGGAAKVRRFSVVLLEAHGMLQRFKNRRDSLLRAKAAGHEATEPSSPQIKPKLAAMAGVATTTATATATATSTATGAFQKLVQAKGKEASPPKSPQPSESTESAKSPRAEAPRADTPFLAETLQVLEVAANVASEPFC
jgi:hypothetical protein